MERVAASVERRNQSGKITMTKSKKKTDKEVLSQIAMMGLGLKEEIKDWGNIGRNAVRLAQMHLAGQCKTCKRQNVFTSERP